MAKTREAKRELKTILQSPDWRSYILSIASQGMDYIGALFSFLLYAPLIRHRAAVMMGQCVAEVEKSEPEKAKNVIRNFMWHMNEDSGNIGWGIPEAFAETLVASPKLAETYKSILISYIMDLGHADNYCDHPMLRRSCYWSVGRVAQAYPKFVEPYRKWLIKGVAEDEDLICRGMAAWALAQLPPSLDDVPALRSLIKDAGDETCELFDGENMVEVPIRTIAENALKR